MRLPLIHELTNRPVVKVGTCLIRRPRPSELAVSRSSLSPPRLAVTTATTAWELLRFADQPACLGSTPGAAFKSDQVADDH
jgi:hypothetical protein